MEVCLLDTVGLPPDCLISVRAGTTRRQAPVNGDGFKLLFPRSAPFASPVKVDFLAPLGSVALELEPGTESYALDVGKGPGGAPMRVTLGIRPVDPAAIAAQPMPSLEAQDGGNPNPSPSSRHRQAMEARAYLDEHSLLTWLQDLMQALITDKPVDPWGYITALIAHETGRFDMPVPVGKAPGSIAGSVGATTATTAASASPGSAAVEAARSVLATAASSADSVMASSDVHHLGLTPPQSRASSTPWPPRSTAAEPVYGGPPSRRTSPAPSGSLKDLRSKLRSTLAQASKSGELSELVSGMVSKEDSLARDSGIAAERSRSLEAAPSAPPPASESEGGAEMFSKMCGLLDSAARNGRLVEVMRDLDKKAETKDQPAVVEQQVMTPRRPSLWSVERPESVGPPTPMSGLKGLIIGAVLDGSLNDNLASACSTPKDTAVPIVTITGAPALHGFRAAELDGCSAMSSARSEWSATTSQADGDMEPIRVRPGACMTSPTMLSPMSVPMTPQTGHASASPASDAKSCSRSGSLLRPPIATPGSLFARTPKTEEVPREPPQVNGEASSRLLATAVVKMVMAKLVVAPAPALPRERARFLPSVGTWLAAAPRDIPGQKDVCPNSPSVQKTASLADEPLKSTAVEEFTDSRIKAVHGHRATRRDLMRQFSKDEAAERAQVLRARKLASPEEEASAALHIQAAQRVRAARKELRRQREEETRAAVSIQALHRGVSTRGRLRAQLSQRPAEEQAKGPRPGTAEMQHMAARWALGYIFNGAELPKVGPAEVAPTPQGTPKQTDSGSRTSPKAQKERSSHGRRSPKTSEAHDRPQPPAAPCPIAARPEPPRQVFPSPTALGARALGAARASPAPLQAPLRSPSQPSLRTPLQPLPLGGSGSSGGGLERRTLEAPQRSASLPSVGRGLLPEVPASSDSSLRQLELLEARLRERTERSRQDNFALRQENARLRQVRETGDKAWEMHRENERLRAELGKLLSFSRR